MPSLNKQFPGIALPKPLRNQELYAFAKANPEFILNERDLTVTLDATLDRPGCPEELTITIQYRRKYVNSILSTVYEGNMVFRGECWCVEVSTPERVMKELSDLYKLAILPTLDLEKHCA